MKGCQKALMPRTISGTHTDWISGVVLGNTAPISMWVVFDVLDHPARDSIHLQAHIVWRFISIINSLLQQPL